MLKDLSCNPGSYVEIVPLGLLCTLQYNSNGILQKIIHGFNAVNHTDADVFDSASTIKLKELGVVPQRINFNQGTTWVQGVFYSNKGYKAEGVLPDCLKDTIFRDLVDHPEEYRFYAGNLTNDSYNFTGGALIATRLSTFGFNVIPGYTLYDTTGVLPIESIMYLHRSPFSFPLISGIMVFESVQKCRYIPANLVQHTVNSLETYWESHGFIRTKISCSNATLDVPYCDIVHYNVTSKSIIISDGDHIVYSRKSPSLFNSNVSRETTCSVCGRKIAVPADGYTQCADPHCASRLYPELKHFLSVLGMDPMDFDTFKDYVIHKDITCLLDIFSLPEYSDIEIECTLSSLINAAVPFEVCRSSEFFQQFTNYLGSVEALDYYLQNPDAIVTDLNLNKMYAQNFATWVKDPANLLVVKTLLGMDNIKIVQIGRKFEGSPIFRNKTVCVTGKFKHGTLEDIISILQSYSAKVTTTFDNTVNCVVIGHFEGEDTNIVDLAVSYNVPVYGEDDFFKAYEIDHDIRKQRDALSSYLATAET